MGERDHYLHGVEDVRSAANTMRSAADTMQSAASTIDDAVRRLIMADYDRTTQIDQWLTRFEAAVAKIPDTPRKADPMREVKMGDGHILHMPDKVQRATCEGDWCECHTRMGNDFYFLPMGSCLRDDKKCSNTKGQAPWQT